MVRRLSALVVLLLVGSAVSAQVTATATIEWTNPTTTADGGPLTGSNSLTKYQIWISTTPLTTLPATPNVEFAASSPLQTSYVYNGSAGQTIYVRMKVCNSAGCSDPTVQVQGQIPWPPARPGVPQNITIKVPL